MIFEIFLEDILAASRWPCRILPHLLLKSQVCPNDVFFLLPCKTSTNTMQIFQETPIRQLLFHYRLNICKFPAKARTTEAPERFFIAIISRHSPRLNNEHQSTYQLTLSILAQYVISCTGRRDKPYRAFENKLCRTATKLRLITAGKTESSNSVAVT